jgi:hypothetical protein
MPIGVDRRLHRRPLPGLGLSQHADRGLRCVQRQQRAAGPAGEAGVERALEAADANRGLGGEAAAGELVEVVFAGFPDFAGDVDRGTAERVFAFLGRAFGEGRAVGGEDPRPRRQLDLAFQVLALSQAGEDEAGIPIDAAVGVGDVDLVFEAPEGDGGDDDRDRHHGLAIARGRVVGGAGFEREQGRHPIGLAVGDDEVVELDRRPRGRVQLLVHGGEFVGRPGRGEPSGGVLLGRARSAGGGAEGEGDDRDDREGKRAGDQATTPLHLG